MARASNYEAPDSMPDGVSEKKEPAPPAASNRIDNNDAAFKALYLQQASREFADDLEKLRKANDFKGQKSVQVLVEALQQGTTCYSNEEKQRMMRA